MAQHYAAYLSEGRAISDWDCWESHDEPGVRPSMRLWIVEAPTPADVPCCKLGEPKGSCAKTSENSENFVKNFRFAY